MCFYTACLYVCIFFLCATILVNKDVYIYHDDNDDYDESASVIDVS